MTSREHWQRVRELLEQLLELPEDERAAALDAVAGDQPELRREVEELLAADAATDDLLPGGAVCTPWLEGHLARALVGARIGSCRILRLLGSGGMGTVYEAMQDNPRRVVAVKVLRPTTTDSPALRRFELEAELLASLRHPNVAQVHEAGLHRLPLGDGAVLTPYLVMEAVEGARSLTEHAQTSGLDTAARLRLLATVCHAVHHAHRQGLVHRDLKPANLLVDTHGQVKVIDFGIAVANTDEVQDPPAGTARYMSPEQAAGGRVDQRSDVFALGLVLGELLPDRGREVEWIHTKATAAEPEARYRDAGELGDEIDRLLRHQPLQAAPPSARYRLRKWLRRHRVMAAAVAVALIGALSGVIAMLSGLAEAQRQRDLATRASSEASEQRDLAKARLEEAAAVLEFWQQMLVTAQPWHGGRGVTVGEVLDAAAARLDDEFTERPNVAAALHQTIGWTLRSLGQTNDAEHHLRRSTEMMADIEPMDQRQKLIGDYRLATVLNELGRHEEAEHLLASVTTHADAVLGGENDVTLGAINLHAITLKELGRQEEALEQMERVLEISLRRFGAESTQALAVRNNLVSVLLALDRKADALEHAAEAARVMRAQYGDTDVNTLVTIQNQAGVLARLQRFEDAEPLCREVLAVREREFGDRHPHTILSRYWLGVALNGLDKHDDALTVLDRASEFAPGVLGPTHSYTGMIEIERARSLHALGRTGQAEEVLAALIAREAPEGTATAWRRIPKRIAELRAGWTAEAKTGERGR